MREHFVTALVEELMGPRGGARETLSRNRDPRTEYVTGVLAPHGYDQKDRLLDNRYNGHLTSTHSIQQEDDDPNPATDPMYVHNPVLNPGKVPPNMGLSFYVSFKNELRIDVCITWARYVENPDGWTRNPKYSIQSVTGMDTVSTYISGDGNKCAKEKAEIRFKSQITHMGNDRYSVSMFVVNATQAKGKRRVTGDYVFQPQIRVICSGDTRLVPMTMSSVNSESSERDEVLYRNRKFFSKGHMTSAVWRDVDPQIFPDSGLKNRFQDACKKAPFRWIDGDMLPDGEARRFSKPDVRTEYIPMYSIPSPNTGLLENDGVLELRASRFSEMWDPSELKATLDELPKLYETWISNLKDHSSGPMGKIMDKNVDLCGIACSRIRDGIKILVENEDARLAFCFANKAIDIQSRWSTRKKGLEYRPFQLGFILMSIESIINPKSEYRGTCDLLWIPTGTGKTEAYLILAAISMAYRRLDELKRGKTGAGVDVLSRYTLRLLAIQQFRRSLSMITAAESLRVYGLSEAHPTGWRPQGCDNGDDFLWGSTPFSIGLWVGDSVTPNKLEDSKYWINGHIENNPGALTLLDPTGQTSKKEPAQIIQCPACSNRLAIPKSGLPETTHENPHKIRWVVDTDVTDEDLGQIITDNADDSQIGASDATLEKIHGKYRILHVVFKDVHGIGPRQIEGFWKMIKDSAENIGKNISCMSTSPLRPGYFYKTASINGNVKEYDFQIFCTNQDCELVQDWTGGSPSGESNGSDHIITDDSDLARADLRDGNRPMEILACFRKDGSHYKSSRIPIPALTVDDHIYGTAPTMIVTTVDKFARLPFEPRAGILFGNAAFHHPMHGYLRNTDGYKKKQTTEIGLLKRPSRPSLIIQDELHLLEGPLGSMVGIYESCIDFLGQCGKTGPKYIASTATMRDGEKLVSSLFARELFSFPPHGSDIDDRFFIRDREAHPLEDGPGGRLHIGIMSPGWDGLRPIVRIWARLAQTSKELIGSEDMDAVDRFWTVTGYFNAVRELAGTSALYAHEIPERIRDLSTDNPRELDRNGYRELSRRTESSELPAILDMLERKYPKAIDGLFTTSMFGTGVDISRIGAMLVVGHPKTTVSYIQSTGRVGRQSGGMVPVFLRASRPRDLSHYEYFIRNHRQMHRTVEVSSVSPFSSGAVERSLGPVMVGMLRNMRNSTRNVDWSSKESAPEMAGHFEDKEVHRIREFLEARAQEQPEMHRPKKGYISNAVNDCISNWRSVAEGNNNLEWVEYGKKKNPVVLGDLLNDKEGEPEAVFRNAPQSLRELEKVIGMQTPWQR